MTKALRHKRYRVVPGDYFAMHMGDGAYAAGLVSRVSLGKMFGHHVVRVYAFSHIYPRSPTLSDVSRLTIYDTAMYEATLDTVFTSQYVSLVGRGERFDPADWPVLPCRKHLPNTPMTERQPYSETSMAVYNDQIKPASVAARRLVTEAELGTLPLWVGVSLYGVLVDDVRKALQDPESLQARARRVHITPERLAIWNRINERAMARGLVPV